LTKQSTKPFEGGTFLLSVAEPELEPVEQQLFAGAGVKVFCPGSGAGYVNSLKMLQKP
jgi:hypothetical protein